MNYKDFDKTYCDCNVENVNKILSKNFKFWEVGLLSNYINKNKFIIMYEKDFRIEARFVNEIPKEYNEVVINRPNEIKQIQINFNLE